MKQAANSNNAPMTGRGIMTNKPVNIGRKPSEIRIPPTAKTTTRLVTPVGAVSPAQLGDELTPIEPSKPEASVPRPSASTPRLREDICGRTQFASLMRWQTVTTAADFTVATSAETTNGSANAGVNAHPR